MRLTESDFAAAQAEADEAMNDGVRRIGTDKLLAKYDDNALNTAIGRLQSVELTPLGKTLIQKTLQLADEVAPKPVASSWHDIAKIETNRTPNPHDPYEAAGYTDALSDPPLVGGGQGRDANEVPGINGGVMFWVCLMAGAWIVAALLAWYGPGLFAR